MYGDGPQEAEHFTGKRRRNLSLVFAASRQRGIAPVQPLLRLPGDASDFFAERQRSLPSQQAAVYRRPILVGPGRLHQHPAQMGVAGFSDRAALGRVVTGMFTRHRPL